MFVGLVNRETRIRNRREALEDQEAAKKAWLEQFQTTRDANMEDWKLKNQIETDRAASIAKITREQELADIAESRKFDLMKMYLERGWATEDRKLDQDWFKESKLFEYGLKEDYEVKVRGWDQAEWDRQWEERRKAALEDAKRNNTYQKDIFDYEWNIRRKAAIEDSKTAYAQSVQKMFMERVINGESLGTEVASLFGGSVPKDVAINNYASAITALGVSQDNPVLPKLIALNNLDVMKTTFEAIQKHHTKLVEGGAKGENLINQFRTDVNEYLSGIIINPADPNASKLQMEILKSFGPLDATVERLIGSIKPQGTAFNTTELSVGEIMSATDLGAYQKLIASDLNLRGSAELNTINKDITRLNDELKTAPPTTQEGIKTLISWLNKRSTEINDALDLASDSKSPNIFPLVRLYGNAAAMEAKSKDPKLENAPILGIFKEAIESAPVDTGSISLHVELIVRELIRPGDKVTYIGRDGQRVTEVVTADDVKQAKAALGR